MNSRLTLSSVEPVTNCDRFYSVVNWESHLVISNDNSLWSQFATASGYGGVR